jgi:hypothetical protein
VLCWRRASKLPQITSDKRVVKPERRQGLCFTLSSCTPYDRLLHASQLRKLIAKPCVCADLPAAISGSCSPGPRGSQSAATLSWVSLPKSHRSHHSTARNSRAASTFIREIVAGGTLAQHAAQSAVPGPGSTGHAKSCLGSCQLQQFACSTEIAQLLPAAHVACALAQLAASRPHRASPARRPQKATRPVGQQMLTR